MPGTFAEWTERMKVYNDYVRALAEYKKVAAENLIRQAEAQQKWQKARAMQIVVRQLELAIRGLNREKTRNNREIAKIRAREKDTELLMRGRRTNHFQVAWGGFEWFMRKALVEPGGDDLYDIVISSEARPARNFLNNRQPEKSCDPVPEDLQNVLEFADWMRSKQYMARFGRPAHRDLRGLLESINEIAGATVETLRDYIAQIEQGTYNAWQPVSIIGVETSATATKIQEAGQETEGGNS